MRIYCPHTPSTPSEVRERLLRLQQDSPHFGPAHSTDAPLRTPIVGNTGLRSLALSDLRTWFETPRQHSYAYQTWGKGIARQRTSLVCPIMRYSRDRKPPTAEILRRAEELVKIWNQTFRSDRPTPPRFANHLTWYLPPQAEELVYFEPILPQTSAMDILFRNRDRIGTNNTQRPHYVCLDTVNLASRIYGNHRLHVVLIGSSVDSTTSNPLSWTWLTNEFPRISFSLAIVLPDEGITPICLPPHLQLQGYYPVRGVSPGKVI
jgi:hypothetical protein